MVVFNFQTMLLLVPKCILLNQIKRTVYSGTRVASSSLSCLQSHKSLHTDASNITSSPKNPQPSFTVKDLINSCALSENFALRLGCSERPGSVLNFLENEGFSRTQIQIIVSKYPNFLLHHVERTLKPKIDFFRSLGCSEAEIVGMITLSPHIMRRSVKNHLVPSFELLVTVLGGRENAVDAVKRKPQILRNEITKNLAPNVEVLRNVGTPDSRIMKMIIGTQSCVVVANAPNRFRKDVEFLMGLGFDPCSSLFLFAVIAKGGLTESGWEDRLKFFRSLGFSNEEIFSMFKKQPITLISSKEKIRAAVEFYIDCFHWSPTQLSKKPNVLLYSLGKRIIPRCSVIQILASRSMLDRNVRVISLLSLTEKDFSEKYVSDYKDEVPKLLDAYLGKLKFDEYNFDPGTN